LLEGLLHASLVTDAIQDDEVGLGEGRHVGRGWLPLVHVEAIGDHDLYLGLIADEFLHEGTEDGIGNRDFLFVGGFHALRPA